MTKAASGLAEFARLWARALAGTCYVSMTAAEKVEFLHALAHDLGGTLIAPCFDPAAAYRVGADLAHADFTAPEALGRTVALIQSRLLKDLGLHDERSRQRLTAVIEALTTGHARATYDRVLDEQEGLRKASLVTRLRAEQALRESEARFRHAALHDALTGLPNREWFSARLRQALTEAGPITGVGDAIAPATHGSRPRGTRNDRRLGVCFIDVDRFTSVIDGLGHPVADRVLITIGERLMRLGMDLGYPVARLGGDEFALLIEETTTTDDAVKAADRALAAIREPVRLDRHELSLSASAGVVECAAEGADAVELMRAAVMTLHWAKADGGGRWAVFDAERSAKELARYELSASMPAALANGEFFLVYQPLVELTGRRVIGYEALPRWRHPVHGVLGPDKFIGLAEDTGLIVPLGQHLLETACRRARTWPTPTFVSYNLSGRQIDEAGLVAHVATVLDRTGLHPARLQLEITESVVAGTPQSIEKLEGLARLGVRIAIDDFGTGYSNLAYLCDLPVHSLKLAGRFLHDGVGNQLLGVMVSLGRTLGLHITAQGVETAEQARRLLDLGCDSGQGHHLGRPAGT